MKVNRQFNTLTLSEYLHLIGHHKKFRDFNTLGLFRSIVESTKLTLEQKVVVRDHAIHAFQKTFEFLQLKDPITYFELSTLRQELTVADVNQVWDTIRANQRKLLESKKLTHRNFGIYSKHICGYEDCHLNGLMTRKGSVSADGTMWFCSDKHNYVTRLKSEARKKERKSQQAIIHQRLASE